MNNENNTENTSDTTTKADVYADPKKWRNIVVKYQKPSIKKAVFQLCNTLIPMLICWFALHHTYNATDWTFWLTIPIVLINGGLIIRTFIIFHDCGHQSFFKSRKANDIVGFITGVLTFTPYRFWHWEHGVHHSTAGNLDRREEGDIWTMTIEEYEASSTFMKIAYRLVRNPFILFTVGPIFLFVIWQRFSVKRAKMIDRRSVWWTNLALAGVVSLGCYLLGWKEYVILQLASTAVSATAGVWMFYVQHQFEDVYWSRKGDWNFAAAALEGSSYYKLPKVLQWFTGNIGFHHIHHLSSRIPNYMLEECHNSEPLFQEVPCLTISKSFACAGLRLLDEENDTLVGFGYLKTYRKNKAAAVA